MVISGFLLKNTTNLSDIELTLRKVESKLQKHTNKEYAAMLGEEIELICDNITMNVLKRNDNKPIVYVAKEQLDKRIQNAKQIGASTRCNLSVYVHVMCFENDTYFKVIAENKELLKAFHIAELKDISLSESECKDTNNTKTELWTTLHEMYKNTQPVSLNLSKTPEFIPEKILFTPVKQRAALLARHAVTNKILNQLSGGEQIPPYRLMTYMDKALEMITSEDEISYEIGEKTVRLEQILLDLNKEKELIFGEKKEDNEDVVTE